MNTYDIVSAASMGLAAGLPVGIVALKNLNAITVAVIRAVNALERIANRLEKANHVYFDKED